MTRPSTDAEVASVARALHIRSCPRGVWCSEAPTKAEFGAARAVLSALAAAAEVAGDEGGRTDEP